MGLSNFHGPNDGVLLLLVMNTVLSVTLLKNLLRSVLQVVGADTYSPDQEAEDIHTEEPSSTRLCTTKYASLTSQKNTSMEECCCVCLSKFKQDEDVSELCYCQHLFHKVCLEKWFDNQHSTCPLCRSVL